MTLFTRICCGLAAAIAVLSIAPAHAAGGLVILLLCDLDAVDGPTRPVIQTSTAFDEVCSPFTVNPPICTAAAEINEDMTCAAAASLLLRFDVKQGPVQAVSSPLLIVAEDVEGEALGGADKGVVTTALYSHIDPIEGDVGLVGCNFFATEGPVATFVDDSRDANAHLSAEDSPLTCADALQAQLVLGRTESTAVSLPDAWPASFAAQFGPDARSNAGSGLPTGKRQHKPTHIVFVYHTDD